MCLLIGCIGSLPAGLCALTNLVNLNIDGEYGNINCYANCLTNITTGGAIANLIRNSVEVCPINSQETGLCDLVVATNIASVSPVDIWACSFGYPNTPPCTWYGVGCDVSLNVNSIYLPNRGLSGRIHIFCIVLI